MKVNVKSAVEFGGKSYKPGVQELPDALYANAAFKAAVKSGAVAIVPRDAAGVQSQASKDARAALAAQTAADRTKAIVDARAGKPNPTIQVSSPETPEPALKSVEEAQAQLPAQADAASPAAESSTTVQATQPAPSAKSKASASGENKS